MNRTFLAVILYASSSLAYAMTATVSSTGQPATSLPGAANKGNVAASNATAGSPAADAKVVADAPTGAKLGQPNAATLIKPASALSAPDVPPKSTVAPAAKQQATQAAPAAQGPRSKALIVPPQVAAPAKSRTDAAWVTTSRTSTSMRRGTLEGFNVNTGSFQVFGQKLSFNAQRVKVFNRDGRPGSIFAIKNGAKVRFIIDSADPAQRRVAVIYVE